MLATASPTCTFNFWPTYAVDPAVNTLDKLIPASGVAVPNPTYPLLLTTNALLPTFNVAATIPPATIVFADTVPATSNNAVGLLVPIPTFPLFATTMLGRPMEFDTYSPYDVPNVLLPTTVKLADGTNVPMPTRPLAATTNAFSVLPASTLKAVFPTGDTTCNAASGAVVPIPTFPPINAAAYLYPVVPTPDTNCLADSLLTSTCNPIAVSPSANAPNVLGSLGLIDWIFKSIPTNFALVPEPLRSLSPISTECPTMFPVELASTVDTTWTPDIAFAVPIVNWLFALSQLIFATDPKLPAPLK